MVLIYIPQYTIKATPSVKVLQLRQYVMGSMFVLWVSCTFYFILRLSWIDVNTKVLLLCFPWILYPPTFGVVEDIIAFKTDIIILSCL